MASFARRVAIHPSSSTKESVSVGRKRNTPACTDVHDLWHFFRMKFHLVLLCMPYLQHTPYFSIISFMHVQTIPNYRSWSKESKKKKKNRKYHLLIGTDRVLRRNYHILYLSKFVSSPLSFAIIRVVVKGRQGREKEVYVITRSAVCSSTMRRGRITILGRLNSKWKLESISFFFFGALFPCHDFLPFVSAVYNEPAKSPRLK